MAPERHRNTFAVTWFDAGRRGRAEPKVPGEPRADHDAASTFHARGGFGTGRAGREVFRVRDHGANTSAMQLRLRSRLFIAALMLAVVAPHTPVESVPSAAA